MIAGAREAPISNTIAPPLYSGIEFGFACSAQFEEYVAGTPGLGRYGRYDNETWRQVEAEFAALESTDAGLLFASGMAAISACALTFVRKNSKIVLSAKCYRNTKALFTTYFGDRMDVEVILVDPAVHGSWEDALSSAGSGDVSLIFIESPSNPHMYLTDVDWVRNRVGRDAIIVVDATFASPVNFRPTQHGADVALHSCTKYISGHGDVMGGVVTGRAEVLERVRLTRNVTGAIADPRGAALIGRSLETLAIRMQHVEKTAQTIAESLEGHPRCERVYYTGLPSHPHHALAQRYLSGHGGVVTFELKGDGESTRAFIDRLTVPTIASNFGSSRSLIEQCGFFTYYKETAAERERLGISDTLVRLSVGYEPEGRLLNDLAAAIDVSPDDMRAGCY
jgi:cystathionine gamma-synthase